MPAVILGVDELNLDHTSQNISREELECPCQRAFLTAKDQTVQNN